MDNIKNKKIEVAANVHARNIIIWRLYYADESEMKELTRMLVEYLPFTKDGRKVTYDELPEKMKRKTIELIIKRISHHLNLLKIERKDEFNVFLKCDSDDGVKESRIETTQAFIRMILFQKYRHTMIREFLDNKFLEKKINDYFDYRMHPLPEGETEEDRTFFPKGVFDIEQQTTAREQTI